MSTKKDKGSLKPEIFKFEKMTRGWFVGEFEPSVFKTKEAEVAFHFHPKGFVGGAHIHKIGTEISLITSGRVKINGLDLKKGDIFVFKPGIPMTGSSFLEDTEMVVVRIPSFPRDKYPWP